MRSIAIKGLIVVLVLAGVVAFAVVRPDQSKAIATPTSYPPLHAGIGSPGSVIREGEQPENPEFFAIVKTDWPVLGIAEPRTAWEFVQRGIHYQDNLENEEAGRLDYEHALEMLEEIAHTHNDPTLPERLAQAHFRLGPIYLHRGEYERAIEHFEVILHENPEAELINLEVAVAFKHLGEEALEHGDEHKAEEYFHEAYEHFERELEVGCFTREGKRLCNQLALFEFGEFLLEPEVHLDGVDQHALALELFEGYLDRAVEHCDTYPLRILEVNHLVEELGGHGNELAIRNCIDRERIQ